jgi:hypothetical protein
MNELKDDFGLGPLPKLDVKIGGISLDDSDNPLEEIEYINNLEEDSKAELTALQKAIKDQQRNYAAKMKDILDSEYWVAVCFQTRAQKEAFLTAIGLILDGDKYVNGLSLAKKMGINLPSASIKKKMRATMKLDEMEPIEKIGGDKV